MKRSIISTNEEESTMSPSARIPRRISWAAAITFAVVAGLAFAGMYVLAETVYRVDVSSTPALQQARAELVNVLEAGR
jgi:hypothetical protein